MLTTTVKLSYPIDNDNEVMAKIREFVFHLEGQGLIITVKHSDIVTTNYNLGAEL